MPIGGVSALLDLWVVCAYGSPILGLLHSRQRNSQVHGAADTPHPPAVGQSLAAEPPLLRGQAQW